MPQPSTLSKKTAPERWRPEGAERQKASSGFWKRQLTNRWRERGKERPNGWMCGDSLAFDLTQRLQDVWGNLWRRWFVRHRDEWNFTAYAPASTGYLGLQAPTQMLVRLAPNGSGTGIWSHGSPCVCPAVRVLLNGSTPYVSTWRLCAWMYLQLSFHMWARACTPVSEIDSRWSKDVQQRKGPAGSNCTEYSVYYQQHNRFKATCSLTVSITVTSYTLKR